MIYVSQEHLQQVEYLISQSLQGNHVLFDLSSLREILRSRAPTQEEAYAAEPHIDRMIAEPTLAAKRAYLETLDPATYCRVVRTYFNIVENHLLERVEIKH